MSQEVSIRIDLNEKGKPIVELKYQGRLKTFHSDYSINRFVGIYSGLEYEAVTPEKYIIARMHETWDGGTEMTAEEWCKCVKTIYSVF